MGGRRRGSERDMRSRKRGEESRHEALERLKMNGLSMSWRRVESGEPSSSSMLSPSRATERLSCFKRCGAATFSSKGQGERSTPCCTRTYFLSLGPPPIIVRIGLQRPTPQRAQDANRAHPVAALQPSQIAHFTARAHPVAAQQPSKRRFSKAKALPSPPKSSSSQDR